MSTKTEHRTRIVLETDARGVDEASRKVKGLKSDLDFSDVVDDLSKSVLRLGHAIEEMGKRSKRSGDGGGGDGEDNRPRRKKRRGFAMGVLQGAGFGEYFPDEGLGANVAGRMVGRGARGLAGSASSLASSSYGGAQGVAQALTGIPFVGPMMAGLLQNAIGTGGSATAYLQAGQGMLSTQSGADLLDANLGSSATGKAPSAEERRNMRAYLDTKYGDYLKRATDLGYNPTEAAGTISSVLTRRGNRDRLSEGDRDRLGAASLGAQRLGIDPGLLGSFSRAQGMGMLKADKFKDDAAGVQVFQRGVGLALAMGLDSSSVVQDLASSLAAMEAKGVTLDVGSQLDLMAAAGATGMGQGAMNLARDARNIGQRVGGAKGPQTGAEVFALRTLYGFGQDGDTSPEALWTAQQKAEKGAVEPDAIERLRKRFGGQGDATAKLTLRSVAADMGMSLTTSQVDAILGQGDQARAGAFSAKEMLLSLSAAPGDTEGARKFADPGAGGIDLAAVGSGVTQGRMKQSAGTEAVRIAAGMEILTFLDNMERSQANMAESVAKFTGPGLAAVSGLLASASGKPIGILLEDIIAAIQELVQ